MNVSHKNGPRNLASGHDAGRFCWDWPLATYLRSEDAEDKRLLMAHSLLVRATVFHKDNTIDNASMYRLPPWSFNQHQRAEKRRASSIFEMDGKSTTGVT